MDSTLSFSSRYLKMMDLQQAMVKTHTSTSEPKVLESVTVRADMTIGVVRIHGRGVECIHQTVQDIVKKGKKKKTSKQEMRTHKSNVIGGMERKSAPPERKDANKHAIMFKKGACSGPGLLSKVCRQNKTIKKKKNNPVLTSRLTVRLPREHCTRATCSQCCSDWNFSIRLSKTTLTLT